MTTGSQKKAASPPTSYSGDVWGAVTAMLVTLPSSIAFGVLVFTAIGPEQTSASFIRYDHIEGGVLLIPPTTAQPSSGGNITAQIDGSELHALIP